LGDSFGENVLGVHPQTFFGLSDHEYSVRRRSSQPALEEVNP
jgi:hypothetical protein